MYLCGKRGPGPTRDSGEASRGPPPSQQRSQKPAQGDMRDGLTRVQPCPPFSVWSDLICSCVSSCPGQPPGCFQRGSVCQGVTPHKNASCNHVIWKILIQYGTFSKNFYSDQEGWFMPIVILTGVHVHTCSDRVFLWVKLSLLHVCPTFPRQGGSWCISVCFPVNCIAAMMVWTFALLLSRLPTLHAVHVT